jgi:peroxiredoxin
MARTASTMLDLGTTAPPFALPDVVTDEMVRLTDFDDNKALLVMFLSRHCPYVKHIVTELARLARDYAEKDIGIVAISANDVANYPDDAPEKLAQMAEEYQFNFPFCFDETQEVARAYTAACTPDFFLFNDSRELVYRGQLDASRPGTDIPVTGVDLRAAIDAVLKGKPAPEKQMPSIGCNIKWKPGNEPDYFK